MIIVNGFQLLTIITKHSILDVAATLDPPLLIHLLLKNIWLLVHLLPNGKELILFQSRRRMISKYYQTINQYLFCVFAIKFLKNLLSKNFSNLLRTKTCYLNINRVSVQVIHICINYLQSP